MRNRWGAFLALAGILFVALNLRPAVASLSPIIGAVERDVPLDSVTLGFLGMLAPVCFAVAGLSVYRLSRRAHAEAILVAALAGVVAGQLLRAAAGSFALLLVGGILAFLGMGIANVLLPPLVKKYFPHRIGVVTALYVTLTSVGALVPPLLAVPLAESLGWRNSLGSWALIGVLAMVPWVGLMLGAGRVTGPPHPPAAAVPAGAAFTGAVGKSRISWAIALVFATSSFNGYAMFAWLPMLLESHAGVSDVAAGQFLSLFAAMGIPAAIVVPLLASRMREPMRLVYPGVGAFVLGYLGLLALPGTATWLWVSAIGLGTLLFPLSLVLVNLRTSSYDGSVALSGFVQGIGYVLGAAGPLLVGVLHAASGSWTSPLVFLTVASLAVITAATLLMTPGSLENSLAGPTVPPALPVPAVPTHLTKERRT